jgi:hypothetical protein
MMLDLLVIAAFLIGLGMLALLMFVLASIRAVERGKSLTCAPPTRAEAVSRRMLGVYVRHPRPAARCRYPDVRR